MVDRGVLLFNNGFVLLVLRFRLEERGVFSVELSDVPPFPMELMVPLNTVFIGVDKTLGPDDCKVELTH